MPQVDDVALTRRKLAQLESLATRAGAALGRMFRGLGDFDDVAGWLAAASPILTAAQSRAVDTQIAYLSALLGFPVDFDREALLAQASRSVDLEEPFVALGRAVNAGAAFEAALESAAKRAEGLGQSGVTRAARAANNAASDPRIVGWRRTLTGKSCQWCVTVSTQRYDTADSASFGHLRCNCGVDPIIGDRDPGRVLNADRTAAPEP